MAIRSTCAASPPFANDFFLDGIRDGRFVYNRDTFDIQSVEVLKGPAATLFGRGSTGGAINQVTKAPTLGAFGVVNADIGTNDEFRAAIDLDHPLSDTSAVRFNAMGESSGVAGRNDVRNRRWGVAPSAEFGIGQATTVTLAYEHLSENDRPDVGVPFSCWRAWRSGLVAAARRGRSTACCHGTSSPATSTSAPSWCAPRVRRQPLGDRHTFRAANYAFYNEVRVASPNFGSVKSGYGSGLPTAATPLASYPGRP